MASLSGLSRGSLHPGFDRTPRAFVVLLFLLSSAGSRASLPAYVHTALERFSPGVPVGWAYTLTTVRNDRSVTERFDPRLPGPAQWTLLQSDGNAPTAEALEKYQRARTAAPGGTQANFSRADIEPGSLILTTEDQTTAEFSGRFRETSAGADKMLGHLKIRLRVDKHAQFITTYILELDEPYSPVLGVRMDELRVEAHFSAPAPGRESLPSTMTSRFSGRIFFISTQEDMRLTYRDYIAVNQLSR